MTETNRIIGDFIRDIIRDDLKSGKHDNIVTRFPPEPNGYLHIGHAKSITLNFGIARDFNGRCHLRFDDTNPEKEDQEYIDSIMEDVKWLGHEWGEHLYFASDYFDKFYEFAVHLVKEGKAYVDDLTAEQIREYRGTLTEPGQNSPYRDRTVEENLDLLARMKAGEFPDGARVLRAKIDMAASNMNMRDPALYRIRRHKHPRTGDKWCIYPMYDYAHELSDAVEGITHSLCTLEFEDHRPIYEWVLDNTPVPCKPRQIEFARLNLTYTVMSKRKLLKLVREGYVNGWDDPRMPTLSGLRRRGFTPASITDFCERIGVAKAASVVDYALLEHCLREELNKTARRVMAVLDPLKVVITNYPEDKVELMEAVNNPENEEDGCRQIPFSREIYIERSDFMENPPKKYFRLSPGSEVRLKHAWLIKCDEVVKDPESGEIIELRCSLDPDSRGGKSPDGRKVRGTLHWVSVPHAVTGEIRLYDRLFKSENPEASGDFIQDLNTDSLNVIKKCALEPSLSRVEPGELFQFMRHGYFVVDPDSNAGIPVFNRAVTLRDTWAKIVRKG